MEEAAEIVGGRPWIEVRTGGEVRDGLPVERIDLFGGFFERAVIRVHPPHVLGVTKEGIRPVPVFVDEVVVDAWTQERQGGRIDRFVHVHTERVRRAGIWSSANQGEQDGQRRE